MMEPLSSRAKKGVGTSGQRKIRREVGDRGCSTPAGAQISSPQALAFSPQIMWLLLLTLPCLGGSVPRNPGDAGRELVGIVGGCDISARRYPWQVNLRFYSMKKGGWEHICAGSLVHPEWVLTAAHCLGPEELEACAFRVQVGQLRLYEDDQPTKVVEIIRHPRYNESLSAQGGADIALLKLEAPVPLSELLHPVSLPPASLDMPLGKTCWVTGWGDIGCGEPLPWPLSLWELRVKVRSNVLCNQIYCRCFPSNHTELSKQLIKDDMLCAGDGNHGSCLGDTGGPLVCRWNCTWVRVGVASWGTFCDHGHIPEPLPPPYHLQEVDVPIVGNRECEQLYQNESSDSDDRVIQDDMLCAGSEGQDSCKGDSGGPLVCRWNCTWVQVGVVSCGKLCGLRGYTGVYARVTSYVSWIRQYVPPFPGP
ncbi:PREDICTED: mastin-like [Colobus angolensis palliatus]|uniref:mastin-like n=1 Tax=Colobus angolensis palliatus TaxID=336983 RepID=UPI0005F517F6|nr:PREDICTED: mastin-like [Colobus angolensis palliatus]